MCALVERERERERENTKSYGQTNDNTCILDLSGVLWDSEARDGAERALPGSQEGRLLIGSEAGNKVTDTRVDGDGGVAERV